jgi:hypothetical protein
MEISVVKCIKNPPINVEAFFTGNRVEKRWFHTPRCPALMDLNIFD